MQHVWEKGEVHTRSWWENLRERENIEEQGVYEKIILKTDIQES